MERYAVDAMESRCDRGGDNGDDESNGANVELSLRLTTGSPAAVVPPAEWRKSLTIFYNGRVCAADVTELQAMAIISMANQEHTDNQDSNRSNAYSHQKQMAQRRSHYGASPASPHGIASPPSSPPFLAGLSMKRSLQRFLQKRKTRLTAVSGPYAGGRPAHPCRRLG